MRDPAVVRRGVAACRQVLDEAGLLLVQDATLPSVTTIVAGEAVRGSWWSHEQAHSIFDVLEELEADATVAKLVAKKQTLVHRDRWPALAAVGAARAAWQLDGLPADVRAVLEQVDLAGGALRADALVVGGGRTCSAIVRDVELRLLLAVKEVHTESGRHAKVLRPWSAWCADAGIAAPLPDPGAARVAFEAVVRRWAPERLAKLLPWPVEVPS
jgi:hypothetical protein